MAELFSFGHAAAILQPGFDLLRDANLWEARLAEFLQSRVCDLWDNLGQPAITIKPLAQGTRQAGQAVQYAQCIGVLVDDHLDARGTVFPGSHEESTKARLQVQQDR